MLYAQLADVYGAVPLIRTASTGTWMDLSNASYVFQDDSKSQQFFLAAGSLTFVAGRPYVGYEALLCKIDRAISAFQSLYDSATLKSVTLEYENLLVLSRHEAPAEYFTAFDERRWGNRPKTASQESSSFSFNDQASGRQVGIRGYAFEAKQDRERTLISLTLSSADYSLAADARVDTYRESLDVSHEVLNAQFDELVTEHGRKFFGVSNGR